MLNGSRTWEEMEAAWKCHHHTNLYMGICILCVIMKYTPHMLGICILCLALIGSAAALSLDDLQSRSRIGHIDTGYSYSPSHSGTCELCGIPGTPEPTTTATITLSPSSRISGKLKELIAPSTDISSVTNIPEEEAVRIALTEIEKYCSCDVTYTVSNTRVGPPGTAYETQNPCWYIAIDMEYNDPENCPNCPVSWVLPDGSLHYECWGDGGGVVIDAVSGEVQAVHLEF